MTQGTGEPRGGGGPSRLNPVVAVAMAKRPALALPVVLRSGWWRPTWLLLAAGMVATGIVIGLTTATVADTVGAVVGFGVCAAVCVRASRQRLEVGEQGVTVVGFYRTSLVAWADLVAVGVGYHGIWLESADGRIVTASVAGKSNISAWQHRRVRVDEWVDLIRRELVRRRPEGSAAREVLARMVEAFSTGDTSRVAEFVAADYVDHQGLDGRELVGPEGFTHVVGIARRDFRRLDVRILDCRTGDETVTGRLGWDGERHDGRIERRRTEETVRTRGGLAVEHWGRSLGA